MLDLDHLKEISTQTPSKIVLLVIDGLGGLPHPETGKTELEAARTPHLDLLAKKGICGLSDPVAPGIIPGSGPGHLALFGYDPVKYLIGRGVLEALGIDFPLQEKDIAARGNFCAVDKKGFISDRRAGRIATEQSAELCRKLSKIGLEEVELFVEPVKDHRFVFVLRGAGLSPEVNDTDPQRIGVAPLPSIPHSPKARKTAGLVSDFIARAREVLADSHPANMLLLRGFSRHPNLRTFHEVYKLNPAAIAAYPMYRGLAKLAGMKILGTGPGIAEQFDTLQRRYAEHDYFFIHIKKTDSAGEDGDFEGKVRVLEELDSLLPKLTGLNPDVIVVTGDHSTPALLKGHSWHPVPFLLSSKWCRPDKVQEFSESACAEGALGRFPAVSTMALALANALKLTKYGA